MSFNGNIVVGDNLKSFSYFGSKIWSKLQVLIDEGELAGLMLFFEKKKRVVFE
jgi:hypothetical protein